MRRLGERCLRAERKEEMFRVYLPDPQACLLSKAGRRFPAAVRGKPMALEFVRILDGETVLGS